MSSASKPPPALLPLTPSDCQAWILNHSGGTVSALWLPVDRLWFIGGGFFSPRMAATCGYTINSQADGE